MCGITGKIHFNQNKKVTEQEIEAMNEVIKHRGPNDSGVYINPAGNAGLGHRRLSIIDLSPLGHNPMCNEDQTVWIVFNGEIYNFQDLRPDLEKKGHKFRSNSDTEVIIHLYEEYGEECLKFLRGMFAFAIWDEKKKKLFLARDRVGKKPLKYYIGKDFIVFASELKAFLNDPGVPKEMDLEAIHHYLTFQYVPHPLTGFKNIKKLPAAHYIKIDLSKDKPEVEIKQYWNLAPFFTPIKRSEKEWEELILNKLNEAVKMRMISDVPLGAFLSGGVDSSAVVSFMAESSTQAVKTFSIGFKEEKMNELPYARQVAKCYQTDHHEFIVEPKSMDILPDLVYHYEEPYADSSALATYYLAKMTRRYVTVALNGDGGDENFAGYPWYGVMKQEAFYRRFPKFIRQLNLKIISALYNFFPCRILRYGEIFTDGSLRQQSEVHTELLSYFSIREKGNLYSDFFMKETIPWPAASMLDNYYQQAKINDPVHQAMFTDINTYLADDLNVKVDIATMMHSMEARSPFLDHELMELIASMPSSLKYRWGKGKYLLKKILKNRLPESLLYRKKQGFGIPIDHWFATSLHDYARDMLLGQNAFPNGLFRESALQKLLNIHEKRPKDGRRIWMMITLKLWLDRFFKN